jgi:hypothetical protein
MLAKTAVSIHIFPHFGMELRDDHLPDELVLGDGGAEGNGRFHIRYQTMKINERPSRPRFLRKPAIES